MVINSDEFSKNDLYLIDENFRNGNDDFFMLFAGDRKFVVPYLYTENNNTYKQAVKRFDNHLFDFEDGEIGKYIKAKKRVRKVVWEDREYIVPFGMKGEVEPQKIAKMWLDKAETKYNMIINAHRELYEHNVDVPPVLFNERSAVEYAKLLEEHNIPVMVNEKTPEMMKVFKFLNGIDGDVKRVVGNVRKKGSEVINKVRNGNEYEKNGSKKENAEFLDKIKKSLKKKILETEFDGIKRYVTKNYKLAVLAGALSIAGGTGYMLNKMVEKDDVRGGDKVENVVETQKYKIIQDGVYTTYKGKKLTDKYGNLEKINNLREEITTMMVAVEGYSQGGFGDTRGNPTVGIGMTVLYDDNGREIKVSGNTKLDDKEIIIQKWRYMEENMLPIIAGLERKCSKEELMATIGAGFCWGPTNLKNSEYLKGLKNKDSVDKLARKLTGFRNPSGLVKREYLLANILKGNWKVDDLKDMPVYYIKNKGFLHCAIYTLDFDDICKIKRDKKGNPVLDKNKNQIPLGEKDGFCSLYLSKSQKILEKICVPDGRFGDYRTVSELIPEEIKDCFKPNFCLSDLQKEKCEIGKDKESIYFNQVIAASNIRSR